MAKKKQRATQTSQGVVCQNKSAVSKERRRDWMESPDRAQAQLKAFNRGKRVMLTIANPNTAETNKRFIRVPANEVWHTSATGGKPRK